MLTSSTVGYFASRYGRKPVLLTIMSFHIISMIALLSSQRIEGIMVIPLLFIWFIFHCLSDVQPLQVVQNIIAVDVLEPAERCVCYNLVLPSLY